MDRRVHSSIQTADNIDKLLLNRERLTYFERRFLHELPMDYQLSLEQLAAVNGLVMKYLLSGSIQNDSKSMPDQFNS
jgi:hypothetical protein